MAKTFYLLSLFISLIWLPSPASSYCYWAGNNPSWVGAPIVEQVTLTSVRVSWQGLLKRGDCANLLLVKHSPTDNPNNYLMSLPLLVSNKSYLVQELQPGKTYSYQVIAREEKGLLGVDYNKSPKTKFTTDKKNAMNYKDPLADDPNDVSVEVYTTNEPVMARHTEYKGMVLANKINTESQSKMTLIIREELVRELREMAVKMEANAIVGLRMETTSMLTGDLEILVYGTAIYFER
eukprot:GFUD01062576.1.p1 GENE.GFUD01062576.1~~GFUD01062576.1.p1  ORF type:complete len:236 (-),score=47.69 GFUD01062576.1:63-770(-)